MGVRGWREVGLDELIEDRSRVTVSNCEGPAGELRARILSAILRLFELGYLDLASPE